MSRLCVIGFEVGLISCFIDVMSMLNDDENC